MALILLDTDILSEILKKKNLLVVQRATDYLAKHQQFEMLAITRYEIIRGLKGKQAVRQLSSFADFCKHAIVHPITDEILDLASDLWAEARQDGHACSDPDLIIAATALIQGHSLATGNLKHFEWITGLTLDNWRQSHK
ncbi:unnamed protein product [marine sediment metagenome]|uniref:PIN domain-containing protein n=1 Tax=marine sediment metagenome TaxID=412755 RepID=X1C1Z1_9ZZZZ